MFQCICRTVVLFGFKLVSWVCALYSARNFWMHLRVAELLWGSWLKATIPYCLPFNYLSGFCQSEMPLMYR